MYRHTFHFASAILFVVVSLILNTGCKKDSTTAPQAQQLAPHYIADYYVDEATVVLDSLAAVANRYPDYNNISYLTTFYPIPESVDQHWVFGINYDSFGYIWIRAMYRNGLFSDNIRSVTYNLRTNAVTRENIEILPLPVHLDPSQATPENYRYEDSIYCIDQITSYPVRLALRKIFWGFCEYSRHHGDDIPFAQIMFDSNYVSLSDEVRQNWVFTVIGANPVTQFQAVSTASMMRGAGYTCTIDRQTGMMYGSGTGLGDE